MSKFTTEVRFICENAAGLTEQKGFNDVDTIITAAAPVIFNFDFPIYDELYRLPLEKKILRHFYTREICAETVGLWKLWLCDKLNVIMPYYNQLYTSALLQFNPFYDVDLSIERDVENDGTTVGSTTDSGAEQRADTRLTTETGTRSEDGTVAGTRNTDGESSNSGSSSGSGNNTRTGDNWDLHSDTPQSGIVGVQNASVVDAQLATYAYLTDAREQKINEQGTYGNQEQNSGQESHSDDVEYNETNSRDIATSNRINDSVTRNSNTARSGSSNVAVNNVENYIEHVTGKRGGHTYSGMLLEYRKTLLNIDEMVLEDLSDLFFGLWD